MKQTIMIGTRGSSMAMYQAKLVQKKLQETLQLDSIIKTITTAGDSNQGDLKQIGGKGLFTKSIDKALINKEIDIAVNCMKDIPCVGERGEDIIIGGVLPREDAREAIIMREEYNYDLINNSAFVIGTSAPRRASIIQHKYPKATIKPIRGTAETRINKVMNKEFDATILCYGGLKRINKDHLAKKVYSLEEFNPAIGSGVITVDCLRINKQILQVIDSINCKITHKITKVERSITDSINGNCFTAISCHIKNHTKIKATMYKKNKIKHSNYYDISSLCENKIGSNIAKEIRQD